MTLAQLLPQARFLLVTTPQPTAQKVARRAAEMAAQGRPRDRRRRREHVRLRRRPSGERFPIFGEGGGQELADELDVPLLGKVPLTMPLREQADAGEPLVFTDPDDPAAQAIRQAARGLIAMFPAELPVLQLVPAGAGPEPEPPRPVGHQPADGRLTGAAGRRRARPQGCARCRCRRTRVGHRRQSAPDEDHGDGEPGEREHRVDAQRVADAP